MQFTYALSVASSYQYPPAVISYIYTESEECSRSKSVPDSLVANIAVSHTVVNKGPTLCGAPPGKFAVSGGPTTHGQTAVWSQQHTLTLIVAY
jgi:hypothetical protein